MTEIKAINTIFDGYKFRSRLEARWAVCLKAAGLKYEYEKEGYNVQGMGYLPDFFISEQNVFIEVKPGEESQKKKSYQSFNEAFLGEKGYEIVTVFGNPWDFDLTGCTFICENGGYIPDQPYQLIENILSLDSNTWVKAALKAKQARFEHGESG